MRIAPLLLAMLPLAGLVAGPACSSSTAGTTGTGSSGSSGGSTSSGSSSGSSTSSSGGSTSSGSSSGSSTSSGSGSGGGSSSGAADSGADAEAGAGSSSGGSSGSSSGSAGDASLPCTYVASGAQTATGSCSINAAYGASQGGVAFTITGGSTFTFGATLAGQTTLKDGTYTLADAAPGAGAQYNIVTEAWMMCTTTQNCNSAKQMTVPPQGSFTLTVTDPGPVTAGVLWTKPQGTLTVIMPAQPGGPASGTVTVTVTL